MVKCIFTDEETGEKCGREVCQGKAEFYNYPLNSMCQHHRKIEIEKMEIEKESEF